MEDTSISQPHAIMISVPYPGHLNPFLNLALKLASNGFRITFVNFEFVHHKLSKSQNINTNQFDIFSQERDQLGLDLHYTTITDGFPIEFDRDLYFDEYWESLFEDFPARVDALVGSIVESNPLMAHFLVLDTGVSTINTRDLMPYYKEAEINTTVFKAVDKAFREVDRADFVTS